MTASKWGTIKGALHKIAKITDETPGLTYHITATKEPPEGVDPKYAIDTAVEITIFVEDETPDNW